MPEIGIRERRVESATGRYLLGTCKVLPPKAPMHMYLHSCNSRAER